ncbi:hypothetical protein HK100_009263 [Physocladia obscura]|uniref:Uncharacterized protein n=1 Tax=Physocladia obscura TaxID=109957 RepID=A0AAD5T3Z8_9FUNG|nr:hypothetical protein HK100_009263 [Physocladia obscura]
MAATGSATATATVTASLSNCCVTVATQDETAKGFTWLFLGVDAQDFTNTTFANIASTTSTATAGTVLSDPNGAVRIIFRQGVSLFAAVSGAKCTVSEAPIGGASIFVCSAESPQAGNSASSTLSLSPQSALPVSSDNNTAVIAFPVAAASAAFGEGFIMPIQVAINSISCAIQPTCFRTISPTPLQSASSTYSPTTTFVLVLGFVVTLKFKRKQQNMKDLNELDCAGDGAPHQFLHTNSNSSLTPSNTANHVNFLTANHSTHDSIVGISHVSIPGLLEISHSKSTINSQRNASHEFSVPFDETINSASIGCSIDSANLGSGIKFSPAFTAGKGSSSSFSGSLVRWNEVTAIIGASNTGRTSNEYFENISSSLPVTDFENAPTENDEEVIDLGHLSRRISEKRAAAVAITTSSANSAKSQRNWTALTYNHPLAESHTSPNLSTGPGLPPLPRPLPKLQHTKSFDELSRRVASNLALDQRVFKSLPRQESFAKRCDTFFAFPQNSAPESQVHIVQTKKLNISSGSGSGNTKPATFYAIAPEAITAYRNRYRSMGPEINTISSDQGIEDQVRGLDIPVGMRHTAGGREENGNSNGYDIPFEPNLWDTVGLQQPSFQQQDLYLGPQLLEPQYQQQEYVGLEWNQGIRTVPQTSNEAIEFALLRLRSKQGKKQEGSESDGEVDENDQEDDEESSDEP